MHTNTDAHAHVPITKNRFCIRNSDIEYVHSNSAQCTYLLNNYCFVRTE